MELVVWVLRRALTETSLGRTALLYGWLAAHACTPQPVPDPSAVADGGASSGGGGTGSSANGGSAGRGGGTATGGTGGRGGATGTGGSSPSTGGSGGTAPVGAGEGGEAGVGDHGQAGVTDPGSGGIGGGPAGSDGYPTIPAPMCEDHWVDYGCDGNLPLDCAAPEVISFDATQNANCPVCAPPPPGARTCERAELEYREFLASTVSASCASYCDEDQDCVAWEIVNACGAVALSLRGLIDEEPLGFAEEFAATRCGPCGAVAQRTTLRRAGSPSLEGAPLTGLLSSYGPRCVDRRCVLQPL